MRYRGKYFLHTQHLFYSLGKLFTGFKVGYIYGKDNVEDVDIKSGGVKIGIIIGLIF